MASGGQETPNDNVEILCKFTPMDYGPLNVIEGGHYNNFTGGNYYLVTPKENVVLYRLYGGKAGEYGQYWSTEPRDGNLGYRMDAAVLQQWNSMDKTAVLFVPAGVHMYEGKVSRQANFLGGGWQVFIPEEIVNHLANIQPHRLAQIDKSAAEVSINKINKVQKRMIKKYEAELNKRLQEKSLKNGSELRKLPSEVRRILQGNGKADGNIQTGKYLVHKDSIPIIGGRRKNVSVSVRIEFVRSETRTYQSGKTIVTETTNYYNRITEITETIS